MACACLVELHFLETLNNLKVGEYLLHQVYNKSKPWGSMSDKIFKMLNSAGVKSIEGLTTKETLTCSVTPKSRRVAPGFVPTINNSLNTIYNHTESDDNLRPLLSQHNRLIQRLRALGEGVTKEQECKGLRNILRSPTWLLWKAQMGEDAKSKPEAIHATARDGRTRCRLEC